MNGQGDPYCMASGGMYADIYVHVHIPVSVDAYVYACFTESGAVVPRTQRLSDNSCVFALVFFGPSLVAVCTSAVSHKLGFLQLLLNGAFLHPLEPFPVS